MQIIILSCVMKWNHAKNAMFSKSFLEASNVKETVVTTLEKIS